MRTKLANLNDCAVPFLSRATANFCWYSYMPKLRIVYALHSLNSLMFVSYTLKIRSKLL